MKLRQAVFLLMLIFGNALQASGIDVIQLHNQTAEELIPVIRPLLGAQDVVTGTGYKLLIRAPTHRVDEIRKLLNEIDRPVQQLLISVRQDQQSTQKGNRNAVSANIGGDNGRIIVGRPTRGTQGSMTFQYRDGEDVVRAQTGTRDKTINGNISQQVRVMSGRPAYISTGVSRPLPGRQITTTPDGVIHSYSTYYDDATTGFYVTPRVNGNRVTLEISSQQQQPTRGYAVESSRLSTIVSGNIGEWISLGGSEQTSRQSSSRWYDQRNSQQSDIRNISIMVTPAN